MRENLVLDANIWLGFVEEIDLDSLDILSDAVDKNQIKIVLPEFVEDEFNKKVNAVLQRTIKEKKVSQSEVTSIVGTIASIFKTAQKIKTIDEGVNDWVRSGKAPNHNANNYEDTYVLNSLLAMSKGESFYFISKDVDYRPKKNDYNLHPDIKERFNKKGLNLKFSTDFKKVLFNDVGFKKPKLESQKGYELYNWKAFKIQVKNKTILNQLQDAITYYYKELDFLPLSYLSNIFPFNSKNSSQTYYSGTRLKTDNKKLFEFFKNALIQSKENTVKINEAFFKSKKDIAIFREVLKKLNYNTIYHLTHDRSTISIHHKTKTPILCDCNNCLLSRHEVIQLNSNIEKKYSTDSPKELINSSFLK